MHASLAADFRDLSLKRPPSQDASATPPSPASSEADSSGSDLEGLTASLQRKAAAKLVQLRRPEYDPPCRVAEGLYIGGVGAARNWNTLHALGVTHVVNASPIVPCFHCKKLRYRAVFVYDDGEEDISQFFGPTNAFIAKGRRKGGVLVHCYAGQSRSTTLMLAYLIAREKMPLAAALAAVKVVRPCAAPNAGFLLQLEAFASAVHGPGEESSDGSTAAAEKITAIH